MLPDLYQTPASRSLKWQQRVTKNHHRSERVAADDAGLVGRERETTVPKDTVKPAQKVHRAPSSMTDKDDVVGIANPATEPRVAKRKRRRAQLTIKHAVKGKVRQQRAQRRPRRDVVRHIGNVLIGDCCA